VGLASGVSAIGLNLFGGVFADKFDQRRLIMTTQRLSGNFRSPSSISQAAFLR
jgi:hypothetical protein